MRYFLAISLIFFIGKLSAQTNTFPSNGNVGIGTVSPSNKLEIKSTGTIGGKWNPNNAYLKITDGSDQLIFDTNEIYGTNSLAFGIYSSGNFSFRKLSLTGITELMTINTTTGNVGIGTTTPDYKLDVLGTIRAKEVKVATGWSDFVFEPDYDLPTLQEVETFIDQNGHLQDIPSAKEVEENGISLGEMDAKLLRKIEELTLYVIELKRSDDTKIKLINELIEMNKNLEQEIKYLKSN